MERLWGSAAKRSRTAGWPLVLARTSPQQAWDRTDGPLGDVALQTFRANRRTSTDALTDAAVHVPVTGEVAAAKVLDDEAGAEAGSSKLRGHGRLGTDFPA